MPEFKEGQQQFPTGAQPQLDTTHMENYAEERDWNERLILFDSYTCSIHQPWHRTPKQLKRSVWRQTWAAIQTLHLVFHQLKLKGWPNYLAHITGRHPSAIMEETNHWQETFPQLVGFTTGVSFPKSLSDNEPEDPHGPEPGAALLKHVAGSQEFPELTLRPPTNSHKTKYLNWATAQRANQIFEDYTESIQQDWRHTPIQHRNEVWGDTFEALQRLFLQFHKLQHHIWTDFHAHTAGRHPESILEETIHWQMTFPAMITTSVPCVIPDWTSKDRPAAVNTEDSETAAKGNESQ